MQEPGDEGGGGRPPPLVPPRAPAAGRKRLREEIDGEALLAAANQNNTAAIRELVGQRGVPVDWCIKGTGGGQTPLHLASFNANVEAIQLLLELGASINMANDISGATPLHLAAMGKGTRPRKLEAIATLVAAGADCFMPDRYGSQPWHYAHDEEARLLMKGPEFKLHQAVLNKDLAALGGLLRGTEAAQVNALGPDGNTPLHIAACVRCAEAVRMLLTAGANPNELNEHGATPLHTAVTVLAEDVVDVLIAAGATIDAKSILVYEYNSRGINWVEPGEGTPQSSPKSLGAPGSAGSFGAGPSPRNRREYRRRESNSSSDGEGGGGDERTFEDKTPLHLAVATKNGLEMARLLLTKGADPNATDAKGRTCLHLALDRLLEVSPMGIPGDTEACLALIRLLLEKRADPLRPHPAAGAGQSLLHSCVQAGHVDALETVLGHTFGYVRRRLLDGQDALGMTPLMLSAQANKVGCLESLLRNGADASITSASGDTARALAERLGHTAAVCILDTFSSFAGVA